MHYRSPARKWPGSMHVEELGANHRKHAMIAKMRYSEPKISASGRGLRARLANADNGWFFAAIASELAARRAERGLSQRELAHLVGTTQSAIARLESGGRPPRIDTLLRIADALECELHVELRPRRASPEGTP
jgi:DNA-binding XRE family transcriptional regulator